MRAFHILMAVGISLAAVAGIAAAEPAVPVQKSGDGSLVLGGGGARTPAPARKDTLHTLLSREVQVYIFRGNTRVWPQPNVLGHTRSFRPAGPGGALAGPYLENLIQKYAYQYGVDPSLVRAVMRHESGFNPHAVSPKGAQGLMQLMPGTAALMGVANPFDPEQNIAGGVGYLRSCLDRFQHNVPLAVAAYNAGPGRVAKSGGVPAIPETQAFVNNVIGTYTGKTPAPLAKAQPPAPSRAKTSTRPALSERILPPSPRPVNPGAEENQRVRRPRPKIIEVRYPKRVAAAKPKEAD